MDYLNISSQKVFSDQDIITGVGCVCGGKTATSRIELEYSIRHKKDISTIYTKCEKCSRNYRFVELQPYHFNSLPISLWISHKLKGKKHTIQLVLLAIASIIWLVLLIYFLTRKF